MKYASFVLLFLSMILTNQQPAESQACPDPAGCSAVSFAAFQHTVGVVQFGNSTGRAIVKRRATLCPESNCNSFFTMSTALVAPRTATGPAKAANPADVTVLVVRRALTTAQTGIFRNTLQLAADAFRAVPQRTRFAGVPFSSGFGNNAIAFLNALGSRVRIVSNVFNPTANTLGAPIIETLPFSNTVGSAISRDGQLVVWTNRTNANNINLNFRQLNPANRKPAGPPEVIGRNLPISPDGDIQTISSIAVSDPIRPPRTGGTAPGPRIVFMKLNIREVTASTRSGIQAADSEERSRGEGGTWRSSGEIEEEENLGAFETEPPRRDEPPNTSVSADAFERTGSLFNPARTGTGTSDFFQSVAIDPRGTYVLYTMFSPSCRKWVLKYQRINPFTGKKIGAPKVLVGCPDLASSPPNTGIIGLNAINLE